MILFINACVRKDSRTKRLASCLLSKLDGEIKEVNLEKENIPPLNNPMFNYAKDFAKPDNKQEMLTKAYSIMSKIYADNKNNEEHVHIISMANVARKIMENPDLTAEELYAEV